MRWVRRIAGVAAAIAGLVALALALLDTDPGHRFVAARIAALRPANGLTFEVGRIDGSLFGRARIADLRIRDLDSVLFAAPTVDLDWRPWRWAANELAIDRVTAPAATLFHRPRTRTNARGAILPGFDIAVGRLRIDRLRLAAPVSGRERAMRLAGSATVRRGRALVRLDAAVAASDTLSVRLDAEPGSDRFDLGVAVRGQADGLLAQALGVGAPVALDIAGDGRWTRWRGSARGRIGTRPALDLALGADGGRYTLGGSIVPGPVARGLAARLAAPMVRVTAAATLDRRQLTGEVGLRSAALAVTGTGTLDLAESRFRAVRIDGHLLRPDRLVDRLAGRRIGWTVMLAGGFGRPDYRYRLAAEQVAIGRTGIERLLVAGRGRWGGRPLHLPVTLSAARVTGLGDVAGGILTNLTVAGRLHIAPPAITGEDLQLRSDKLRGRLRFAYDLRTGRWDVGLAGGLARYLVPGIGIVDITSTLDAVPGPGGRGTRLVGRGVAQVVRLDNGFFQSLAGDLPRVEAALERTADGVLRFSALRITGPQIALSGTGYRRPDGSVRFEGGGTQARWGPVRLVLDGRIGRPTLDLLFAQPNRTLGLADVRAHLDPTPQGFAFRANGGSRLGPVSAAGAIVLRPGPTSETVVVDALEVTGTRARGSLELGGGGLAGRLQVAGGGWTGAIDLDLPGGVQRVRGTLAADRARIAALATVRRGTLGFTALLDPAGTRVEATAQGQGLRRDRLAVARFAGNLALVGGTGELRASVAGSRGRAFDVQTVTAIRPEGYGVSATGSLDGRPLRLLAPAAVTREGDGWRVAPTRLSFAGGEAALSGRIGGAETAVDARLTTLPLTILDIAYPGLGLSGTASGTLTVQARAGAVPTGRIAMTVRGLSRSGLVLTSRPIDLGLAGVLGPERLGMRAVAASGGQTIGRAQALLRLAPGGTLAARVGAATVQGQLRYTGPADTLWRLTGVELFDLSGPVRIAADVGGQVSRPAIRGAFSASGARIESASSGTVLTGVEASGRFAGSRLAIERFAADASGGAGGGGGGGSGRVTGTGSFDFAAAHGIGLDLSITADRARMIARDEIAATVTGPLRFRSDGAGGTISGDVALDRASYRLGRAAAAAAVPRLRLREINVPGGAGEEDETPVRPWTLAIRARAPGAVSVSGLGLTSEWSADLQIGGAPNNPAITGRARLVRGNYEFAGRDFALDRGVIRFDGSMPANPALDIAANADTTGLNASIRVTGTALQPEVGFVSTPALPEDELLSRLLFGTSITNLSAPEALQLAAAVAALREGGQGLNPINAVRRAAGLDRLRILPADPQTGQGTAIAAGKYVTRRLYGELVTDGQGYSATRVEFQVTRWLSLLSSISTLGRQSANVRVSRDY